MRIFPADITERAQRIVADLAARKRMVATAESCTGGLIAGALTEIAGSSVVVDRGFVTYSNAAKTELLGVPEPMLGEFGAVSRQTAVAMAEGALSRSCADFAIAVTGIAGPGGGNADKPVGLVHLAALSRDGRSLTREMRYGEIGRDGVRLSTVRTALDMLVNISQVP